MNKIYKTLWCEQTGTYVAVAENSKSRGKKSSSSVKKAAKLAGLVAAGAVGMSMSMSAVAADQPAEININSSGDYSYTGVDKVDTTSDITKRGKSR